MIELTHCLDFAARYWVVPNLIFPETKSEILWQPAWPMVGENFLFLTYPVSLSHRPMRDHVLDFVGDLQRNHYLFCVRSHPLYLLLAVPISGCWLFPGSTWGWSSSELYKWLYKHRCVLVLKYMRFYGPKLCPFITTTAWRKWTIILYTQVEKTSYWSSIGNRKPDKSTTVQCGTGSQVQMIKVHQVYGI